MGIGTMSISDWAAFFLAEALLLAIFSLALSKDLREKYKRSRLQSGAVADVRRGEKSMAPLYTFYGIATVVFSLFVTVAEGVAGYKVTMILVNYCSLTYLFFFSSWFRNRVFYPLFERMKTD